MFLIKEAFRDLRFLITEVSKKREKRGTIKTGEMVINILTIFYILGIFET